MHGVELVNQGVLWMLVIGLILFMIIYRMIFKKKR
jgi:hypothetical protein